MNKDIGLNAYKKPLTGKALENYERNWEKIFGDKKKTKDKKAKIK